MALNVEASFGKRVAMPSPRVSHAASSRIANPVAERFAGLDLLRLLAALGVVAFHYAYAGPSRGSVGIDFPEVAGFAKYGFLGVDLFFLISGFVIAASAEARGAAQFAVARALRLYPAHLVCMSLTAIALLLAGRDVGAAQWLANLTMVAPAVGQPFMDGVYWSIVLEIVFYGWVALLLATGLYQRHLLGVIAIWLAVAFVNEAFLQVRALRLGLLTEYAGLFAAGLLMHRIRRGDRSLVAFALTGFAFALGLIHAAEHHRVIARLYGDNLDINLLWAAHVGIHLALIAALWLSARVPSTATLAAMGGLTYPLYLLHQQAGYLVLDALAPLVGRWSALAITTTIALVAALVIHRFAAPTIRRVIQGLVARVTGSSVAGSSVAGRTFARPHQHRQALALGHR